MKRRAFLGAVGGAVALPLAAYAQQREQVRRVGILMAGLQQGDAGGEVELNAFRDELRALGWHIGGNIQFEYRWPGTDNERVRESASSLAASHVDVVLSRATMGTASMLREAPSLPVVFVLVVEPVRSGFVQNLVRPGGNVTGFSNFEPSIGGKWVELLKAVAPRVSRIGLLFNPRTAPFAETFLPSAKAAGDTLQAGVSMAPVDSDEEIERTIEAIGANSNGGIIGITDAFVSEHREAIVSSAARHRVPAIYGNRILTWAGGLAAYAADYPDLFRRSASYVDRILKGTNPGELPVQPPSKYELSINLKAAKNLGLNIPPQVIGLANEVIE